MSQAGTIVVTGPAGGMTSFAVTALVEQLPSTHFILLVRDPAKVAPNTLPPPSSLVEYVALDLSDLSAVQRVGAELADRVARGTLPPIKCVIESAALQMVGNPSPVLTKDGYETTVAVNHLAHVSLTLALLPAMDKEKGRIVIVGSDAHRNNYEHMKQPAKYRPLRTLVDVEAGSDDPKAVYDAGMGRYGTSKLLQTMFGHELARRLADNPEYASVRVVIWEPGSMGGTGLFRTWSPMARFFTSYLLTFERTLNYLQPSLNIALPTNSAKVLVRLVTEDEFVKPKAGGARYYRCKGDEGETFGEANDEALCQELWKDSVDLLGVRDTTAN